MEFRKGTQCKVSTLLSLWSPRQISFLASKYDDAHSMLPTKKAQPSVIVQRCQGSMMWAWLTDRPISVSRPSRGPLIPLTKFLVFLMWPTVTQCLKENRLVSGMTSQGLKGYLPEAQGKSQTSFGGKVKFFITQNFC